MRLRESELDHSIQKEIDDIEDEELDDEYDASDLEMTREQRYSAKREAIKKENLEDDLDDEDLEDETEKPTHTMMLDGLIKEVEIFTDDEDFITPTKKWKTVLGIVIFLIIVGVCVFLIIHFKPFEKKKKNNNEDINKNEILKDYRYELAEKQIVFYDGETEINAYDCEEACSIYSLGRYQYFSKEDYVIALQDGENILLYNFKEGKKITDFFTRFENLIDDEKTVAFIVADSLGKVGIVNVNGETVLPFEYDNLGYSFGGGDVTDYSYEKDVITASKDGKWGLITLSDGKEKIPFEYEDIYFNGNDALAVKKEGLWYLVDLDGKTILEEGYDMLYPLSSYVLVAKEEKFNILNYKGEKVVSKDIPTYVKGFRGRTVSEVPIFKVEIDGTIVNIFIMKNEEEYSTYKFNTVNGEVTEVLS